jgi:uncharacterized protein (TIGR02996 family)
VSAHDGFLHEILASPGDDGPRLVYADWLQERGDCHQQRQVARGTADQWQLKRLGRALPLLTPFRGATGDCRSEAIA